VRLEEGKKMTAPKEISRLVENFDRHRDEYHAAAYNEA
jgi:hypothetical protein